MFRWALGPPDRRVKHLKTRGRTLKVELVVSTSEFQIKNQTLHFCDFGFTFKKTAWPVQRWQMNCMLAGKKSFPDGSFVASVGAKESQAK